MIDKMTNTWLFGSREKIDFLLSDSGSLFGPCLEGLGMQASSSCPSDESVSSSPLPAWSTSPVPMLIVEGIFRASSISPSEEEFAWPTLASK